MASDDLRALIARFSALETVLFLLGCAVFLFLLVEVESFLGPVLLGFAAAVLVWPMRHHKPVRGLLTATVLIVVLWMFFAVGAVLAPFVVAFVLAYVLAPVVAWARRRGVPRWGSAAVLTLLIVGLIVLIAVLIVPQLVSQMQQLANRLIEAASGLPRVLSQSTLLNELAEAGWIDRQALESQLTGFVSNRLDTAAQQIPDLLRNVLQSLNTLLGVVTLLVVFPVILFYLLRDFPRITRRLAQMLPTVDGHRRYLRTLDQVVGSYLRGQLLIALIAAINIGFWLSILGVPFALLLGAIGGLLNLIPQIGAVLTNILASIIAVTLGDPWLVKLVYVQIVLLGQSLLETTVLTPNIMSVQLDLHPALIIFTVFFFGTLLGFLGFLIAVPITALLVTLYQHFEDHVHLDLASYSAAPDDESDEPR